MYVTLRFGLVNTINTFLRLKVHVGCGVGLFSLNYISIEFAIPNLSLIYFLYQKSLKTFKFVAMCFENKDQFVIKNWYKMLILKLYVCKKLLNLKTKFKKNNKT